MAGGVLYVVATPIGNLEDVTLRALRVLREVDLVAAEDTRRTRVLLAHHGIDRPLVSYHDAVERTRRRALVRADARRAGASRSCPTPARPASPTRATTSCAAAVAAGIPVVPIPGPSAVAALVSVAGVPSRALRVRGLPAEPRRARGASASRALAGETARDGLPGGADAARGVPRGHGGRARRSRGRARPRADEAPRGVRARAAVGAPPPRRGDGPGAGRVRAPRDGRDRGGAGGRGRRRTRAFGRSGPRASARARSPRASRTRRGARGASATSACWRSAAKTVSRRLRSARACARRDAPWRSPSRATSRRPATSSPRGSRGACRPERRPSCRRSRSRRAPATRTRRSSSRRRGARAARRDAALRRPHPPVGPRRVPGVRPRPAVPLHGHRSARKTTIPVPRVLWFEEDASVLGQPFYVMERVDGVVPSDNPPFAVMGWLAEASAEDQAALWRRSLDVLAQLHALDWRGLGLELPRPPAVRPDRLRPAARLLRRVPAVGEGRAPTHPLLDDTFAWLKAKKPDRPGPAVPHVGRRAHLEHDVPRLHAGRRARLGDGVRRRARGRPHVVLVPDVVPHRRARHPEPAGLPRPRRHRGDLRVVREAAGCGTSTTSRCGPRSASAWSWSSIDEVVRQNGVDMPVRRRCSRSPRSSATRERCGA